MQKLSLITSAGIAGILSLVCMAFMEGQTPAEFDQLSTQATAAREQGHVHDAIDLYSRAVQANPKWADGWWFLGSLNYGAEAYVAGRDALSHYLELMPNAAPALALRGLCEFETGEYTQSLADLRHGIASGAATQPHNEQILRYHIALLLTRTGQFEAAIEAYKFFAQKGISNPELFVAIGLAGLHMPLLPKEVPSDQQGLASAVGSAGFEFLAGDERTAAQSFQRLFQQFPAAPSLHYFYGNLLYSTDPDSSIIEFERELKVFPESEIAQVMTPWALLMRNQPGEALPYARQAAQEHPDVAAAQLVLGRALAETGTLPEGIQHLEQALKLEPDNLEVHIALAKAYSRSGRDADAQRERSLCLQMTKDGTSNIAQR